MNTALVSLETVDLLSRITGQKLNQRDLTSPLLFLATLVTVLSGVIYSDGLVTAEEKQRLQVTLNQFAPTPSMRQFTQLLVRGVGQHQVYKKLNELVKLAEPLSLSQKLLIVGLGYEMASVGGDVDVREKRYLQVIANHLKIDYQYLAVLEASFIHQGTVDSTTLEKMKSLLDPAQFRELEAVFVKAASGLVAILPTEPKFKKEQQHYSSSYNQLKEFQKSWQQLNNLCDQLYQIIKDCADRDFLPSSVIEEIGRVSQKLRSRQFRLAVVGEFSQGKSTLLNALLGEEIQPVRAIPCSGTVTVLRYGAQKRVVCRYKNGREEEVPFEQYKAIAAISKEAALAHRSEELAHSDIDEIIFEHPELDLCKSGVEIVDSPGLNEHPERTAITQKLLKNTDAAIFLVNAMRLLPEKEKDLLQDVKNQLSCGRENEPSDNLFILVNFIDLLDEEEDRIDVRLRLENFVKDRNLLSASENRIYYVSAKAALKAILNGTENEYLKSFHNFTQSLEQLLTVERGKLEINQAVTKINSLIDLGVNGIAQAVEVINGKIKISEATKQEILEQVGEASGRDVRIHLLAEQLIEQVIEEAAESWDEWWQGLGERMVEKAEKWHSEHNPVFSQDKLIRDYIDHFMRDLSKEIDDWGSRELKDVILQRNLKILEVNIEIELEKIKAQFISLDQQVNSDFSNQLKLAIEGINDDFVGAGGFLGGVGVGGALAAGLLVFTGLGLVAVILTSVAAAIASSFGLGMLDFDGLRDQIKFKVLDLGFQKFEASMDNVSKKLYEIVTSVFDSKVEAASQVIEQAISLYENLLEQQDKAHIETLEQREAEKAWLTQKCQEIKQVQMNIGVTLNELG